MTHPTGRARLARAARASVCALALLGAGPLAAASGALAQEAASAVQDVTLQDVTLPFGSTVLTMPRVTVSGTRLSKDDLLAILKADSPEPWASRLARLDAASLTIPELRSVHAGPGASRQTVVYRDVAARDVRAGRAAELSAAGAAVTVAGGPETGSGTYGRIGATDIDLAALARLYAVAGDGKGPVQRVYATVSVADVVYTDDRGTTVKLARVEGRELGGRQIPGGWTGALDAFAGLDLDKASPAERARVTAAAADLIEAVSVGGFETRGLSISETKSADPLLLEVGRMAYAGQGPEAGMSLEDLAFAQKGVRSRVGKVTLTGFSLAPTVEALRRLSNPQAEATDDALRRLTPVIGTLAMQDISLDLPSEPAKDSAKDAAKPAPGPARRPEPREPARDSAGDPFESAARQALGVGPTPGRTGPAEAAPRSPLHVGLRNAAITFGPPRDGVPTASRLSLTGLTLPAATVSGVPGLGSLTAYGYQDLDLNVVADTAWDEGRRELSVREVSISGKDMGTVRLTGTLGGIGPEIFDPDAGVSGLAMLSATAKALDLTIENTGLFERFIAAQSKVLSLKPDELRQEYVTASVLGVPVILGNSPAAKAIGAAMGQFVTKPGRLSVTAKAKDGTGLGVADFSTAGSPGAVLDKLDVDAKAN
ncbi:hypothetical protein [Methylobacterium oxalidis]|uniref:AsmA-like C-terminal domain-containing protein n=1 Tax=Methylobacterium oxalidis TaxID=944322 RepID=A0A512J1X7_9HYPH|nr:hypothetical protein [Methylobacterium oxalidis]GEP03961.1 hypothetical protein MOX02_19990 [Methylobacterium oxalidis]GJE33383.1 hypothetical protein LDDCCGHA_3583 [Methylobacterium oxalidis]GLS63993.1 hypothetical protein GCM10007888_23740 [Methylobacterium oxalidis]